ncbi:MFS transporter [Salinispora tropica]|uniref:Major facilitator superfamily MFS_1 n=1 Tax=Salinispora tropica (strain ATCC BAA-916 / DSM 44818 / JCM 13857 / NBRC 105044 / CNB-440) TaxID=369723 RepID=A4X8K7_SALTO|nr:MFS transporter [Salinispora tropica]ABP55207.1 major facilitator superfamily MFS_1 [Salinispora tropica CNB-440]WIW80170.1 MFS transporter [Salinispora tropica CNB-440]
MATAQAKAGRREWIGLAVLVLVTLIISMDMTVLSYALPFITADLAPTSSQLLWITDVYAFVLAGLLIPMGTLGDRIGRRRLLMIGAAVFGVASVATALSNSPGMLIGTRAVMGAAGATLMPSTMSLIRNMFHDENERRVAIGVWAAGFSAGGVIGLVAGGALLQYFSWGTVFEINVPIMLLLLILAPLLLPEFRNAAAGRPDLLSTVLAFVAVLPMIWGIKQFAEDGMDWPPVAGVAAGLIFLAVFVLRQRRLDDPVIDVRLFRAPAFSAAVVMNLLANFALVGFMFFISQYLQLVLGLRPFTAGLWSLPAAGAAGVGAAVLAPVLAQRFKRAYVAAGGLLVATVGCVVLAQVGDESGLALVVLGQALMAGGVAMVLTLSAELIVSTAPPERAGAAAGLSETGSQFGAALGVAILGSIGAYVYRRKLSGVAPDGVPPDSWATARETLGGAVEESRTLSTTAADTLVTLARAAFTDELRAAAIVSAGILLVTAILAAVLLRNVGGSVPGQGLSDGSDATPALTTDGATHLEGPVTAADATLVDAVPPATEVVPTGATTDADSGPAVRNGPQPAAPVATRPTHPTV